MNVWKKVSMLTLVVALAMSFCVMANATANPQNPVALAAANIDTTLETHQTTSIDELTFTVTLSNPTGNTDPRPAVTFNYTVAKAEGNTAGPEVSFPENGSSAAFTLVQNGAAAEQTMRLTVASATSVANGEYAYTITQSAVSSPAGFSTSAIVYTLKLAVNGGKVTQAVLLNGTTSATAKVAGFANTYDPTDKLGNVVILKTVGGMAADASDETGTFNLAITIPSGWEGLGVTLAQAGSKAIGFNGGNAALTLSALSADLGDGTIYAVVDQSKEAWATPGLANTYALTISGLPVGSTVTVKDKTDSQKIQAYENSAEVATFVQSVGGSSGGFVNSDTSGATTATTVTTRANTTNIEYFATRVPISLTGVTLRYAPYLLTLGAGITVLPLSRRYKKREEDV